MKKGITVLTFLVMKRWFFQHFWTTSSQQREASVKEGVVNCKNMHFFDFRGQVWFMDELWKSFAESWASHINEDLLWVENQPSTSLFNSILAIKIHQLNKFSQSTTNLSREDKLYQDESSCFLPVDSENFSFIFPLLNVYSLFGHTVMTKQHFPSFWWSTNVGQSITSNLCSVGEEKSLQKRDLV